MTLPLAAYETRRMEKRIASAHALAAQHGAQIHPKGKAWRVVGPTVDMLVSDLANLSKADFAGTETFRRSQFD